MKKLALVSLAVFAMGGCMTDGGAMETSDGSADANSVKMAIKAAEDSIKKAKSAGGEWRDSKSKFIKKAKAASAKGDFKTAMKLAKQAKFQGEMGLQQAMEQKSAKPWLF